VNESTFPIAEKFLLSAFSCPSLFQSSQLSSTGLPTWLYRYVADWENIRLYDGSGAFHTSELYMVFGTSEDVTGDPATEAEKEMSAIFQKAWAAFADDPVEGLEKVMGWPVFSPDDETLIRLGNENQAMAEFVSPSLYGSPCSTIVLGSLATPHSSP
jgi:carboxylesterase type B